MSNQTIILLGGPEAVNGDEGRLQSASGTSRTFPRWSSLKHARRGHQAFIYIYGATHAIVASATVLQDARPGRHWRYEAKLGEVRWLPQPISLQELRLKFPNWQWLKFCQGNCYVDPKRAAWLEARASGKIPAIKTNSEAPANGAGFGDTETIPLVERAAVTMVCKLLRKNGYRVESREKEKLGYDLDATKGPRTLHIEVKGISGSELQFPITTRELQQAEHDKSFHLYAVTQALTRRAEVHQFSSTRLLKKFGFTPISFMAKTKARP